MHIDVIGHDDIENSPEGIWQGGLNLEQDQEEISLLFQGEYKYKRIQHYRSRTYLSR